MNKLIPFSKLSKIDGRLAILSGVSVVINGKGEPVGFVFGRDAFISLLELIDEEFEKKIGDPKKSAQNLAGKLIDKIEENLSLSPKFKAELEEVIRSEGRNDWIPVDEVAKSLNV